MIRRKQGYFFLLQSLSILLVLTAVEGCQERTIPASPLVLGGETQGTIYSIKLSGLTQHKPAHELQAEIDTLLAQDVKRGRNKGSGTYN